MSCPPSTRDRRRGTNPEGAAEEDHVGHTNAALVEVVQVVPLGADLVLLYLAPS
jgi:hypothetical protein